jgi:hypothetical protein
MIETAVMLETYIAKDSNEVRIWIQDRWKRDENLSSSGNYFDDSDHCNNNGHTRLEDFCNISNNSNLHDNDNSNDSGVKNILDNSSNISNNVIDIKTDDNSINTSKSKHHHNTDWWVVKSSKGNGGRDIWILNSQNSDLVIADLQSEEYVIQRYVLNPTLYKGKKFHFRMYALILGDLSGYVYQKAFILTAGLDYDCDNEDINKHITNLSVNKYITGHPGQVPVNVKEEYPKVQICIQFF